MGQFGSGGVVTVIVPYGQAQCDIFSWDLKSLAVPLHTVMTVASVPHYCYNTDPLTSESLNHYNYALSPWCLFKMHICEAD